MCGGGSIYDPLSGNCESSSSSPVSFAVNATHMAVRECEANEVLMAHFGTCSAEGSCQASEQSCQIEPGISNNL